MRGGSPMFPSSMSMPQSSLPPTTMRQVEGSCISIWRCCHARPHAWETGHLHDSRVPPDLQCSRYIEPQPNTSGRGCSFAASYKELHTQRHFRRLQGCEGYGPSQDPPSSCLATSAGYGYTRRWDGLGDSRGLAAPSGPSPAVIPDSKHEQPHLLGGC